MTRTDETDARLHRLINRTASLSDPQYRLTIDLFRQWLTTTEMALEDESVDAATIQRVLNRMVYGAPYAADAIQRIERSEADVAEMMRRPPNPVFTFDRKAAK